MVRRIFSTAAFLFLLTYFKSPSASAQEINRLKAPLLVLSQQKFISTDTVWFKAYLLNSNNLTATGKNRIRIDIIDSEGKSRYHSLFIINDGLGFGQFPIPEDLSPGRYLIAACMYDGEINKPAISTTEILVVNTESLILPDTHPTIQDSEFIDINLHHDKVKTRDYVAINITLRDSLIKYGPCEFSVTIKNQNLLGTFRPGSWATGVNNKSLGSPTSSLSTTQSNRILSGIAYNRASTESLPDSAKVFFYLQKSGWRYQTLTGPGGSIKLLIPDFVGQDEFFYLAEVKGKIISDLRIEWETPDLIWPAAEATPRGHLLDPYAVYAEKRKLIDNSFAFYNDAVNDPESGTKTKSLIDQIPVNIVINTTDYELFPSMAEYVKEVIPAMYTLSRKRMLRVKLKPVAPNFPPPVPDHDPVYFIDGYATSSSEAFLSLKPADVISIKIANDPRKLGPFGLMGKNGIVIVTTKRGGNTNRVPENSLLVQGIHIGKPFRLVTHTPNDDKRKPDFRSVLYWNPSLVTDTAGKAEFQFYTSDDVGQFIIEINGFINGKFFSAHKVFEVVN